jgi:choice-of-anchor A domain-containing protein
MRPSTAGIIAAMALLTAALTAQAAPISVATLLTDFNVITDQAFVVTNDIYGPVLIGGTLGSVTPLGPNNLMLSTGPLNLLDTVPLPVPIAGLGEVNVFGNVVGATTPGGIGSNPAVGTGSVVLIGGTNPTSPATQQSTFIGNGTGSVLSGHSFPYNFATDIWTPLTNFSTGLQAMPTTCIGSTCSSFSVTGSVGTFTAEVVNGVAVWNIMASALESTTCGLTFSGLPSNAVGIVNVIGNFSSTGGCTFNSAGAMSNVIFNFDNATSVAIGSGFWDTSILAPDALLTSSVDIYGTVVAENYASSAETHTPGFDCSDGACAATPPADVPEPGSLALLGSALATFGAPGLYNAIRRRRA